MRPSHYTLPEGPRCHLQDQADQAEDAMQEQAQQACSQNGDGDGSEDGAASEVQTRLNEHGNCCTAYMRNVYLAVMFAAALLGFMPT